MAKFYGAVGFIFDTESSSVPDVVVEEATERYYKGDLLRNNRRLDNGVGLNDDVKITNRISIVSDPYATSHIFAIRYVKWMGAYWKVAEVEVESPRIILTLGGVYNGKVS